MEQLPRSARLVCWFNAWCAAAVAPDDLIDAVTGEDTAHTVLGLGEGSALSLMLGAGALRRAGADAATLALPAPGDPVGVGGPRAFNEAAVEAGEAAVFPSAGIGLVPSVVGSGVFWRAFPAAPVTTVPDVASASAHCREALLAAAARVEGSGPGPSQPEVGDILAALRASRHAILPAGYSARADRLAGLAIRCVIISQAAGERSAGLLELERTARHALVAAGSETPQQRATAGG